MVHEHLLPVVGQQVYPSSLQVEQPGGDGPPRETPGLDGSSRNLPASPRLRTDMVRLICQNHGLSTAKLAQAAEPPAGFRTWGEVAQGTLTSRRWSIPTTPGTTTESEGAAASKGLDGGLRLSVRGSTCERGNCNVPAAARGWVRADLASGDRTLQGRGSVVVAEVTSGHGDGNAVTGRREPAR